MANALADKACVPCKGGTPPMGDLEIATLSEQLGGGWRVAEQHHLEKLYKFKNFKRALQFTNIIGEIAERENHHPDIYLSWGKVELTVWTHAAGGLTENDFILAAKADQAFDSLKAQPAT